MPKTKSTRKRHTHTKGGRRVKRLASKRTPAMYFIDEYVARTAQASKDLRKRLYPERDYETSWAAK